MTLFLLKMATSLFAIVVVVVIFFVISHFVPSIVSDITFTGCLPFRIISLPAIDITSSTIFTLDIAMFNGCLPE